MTFRVQLPETEFFEIPHVLVFKADSCSGDVAAGLDGSCEPRQGNRHWGFTNSSWSFEKDVVGFTDCLANEIEAVCL